MSTTPLEGALRQTLLHLQAPALSDAQLLARFVADADQAAFGELVRRHGAMVLRVCQRVVGHTQDAEDAFQATFVVLVRKAATLQAGELGGWLHGVAYRVAQKARSQALRRRAGSLSDGELASLGERASGTEGAPDTRAILDEELDRLPNKYRLPLVLCYLEGKTVTEAAQQLGWNRATLGTRLLRGRERLRQRLAGRGLNLSAVAFTAALTPAVSQAVPTALLSITTRSCAAMAAGQGGTTALSGSVAAIVQAYLATTSRRRVLVLLGLFAMLLFGSSLSLTLWHRTRRPAEATQANLVLPHADYVFRVAFAADGKTLYSSGFDGQVRRWATATGQPLPSTLKDCPYSLAVSPDDSTLAAGSWHGTVKLWDTASGKELLTLIDTELFGEGRNLKTRGDEYPTVDPSVTIGTVAVQFSPDSRLLAVGHERDSKVRLYRLESLRNAKPDGRPFQLTGTHAFRHDPYPAAKRAYSVNPIAVRPDRVLNHQGMVRDLAFSPDGNTLIAAGSGELTVWDLANARARGTLAGASRNAVPPLYSPDGKRIASVHDGQVRLWDSATLRETGTLDCQQGLVLAIACSPDSKLLASAGSDGTVKLWDPVGRRLLAVIKHSRHRMGFLAFAPDGRTLATAGFDKTVKLWEVSKVLAGN